MKVALVNPSNPNMYGGAPPVSLGILATYIRQFGHDVKIIDLVVGQNYKEELEVFNPEIVGITGTTPAIMDAYDIADYAKSKGYKVVMGGPHVSVMPNEAMNHADTVVVGEGEVVLKKIIDENLKGIIKGEPLMDIDSVAMPSYDLMDMEWYLSTIQAKLLSFVKPNARMGTLLSSRGCPYNCSFCHNSFKNLRYRFNSPERVVDEIEYLIDRYEITSLFFIEDNFFVNKERVKKICKLMIARGIKIPWGGNSRVDNLDLETMKIAKEAGCRQITFGWESGSQRMLDAYNKRTTVKQNEDSIKLCNEVGILCNGTLMIGGPNETLDDMRKTRDFIVKNNITGGVGVCATTPFPGTKLWDECIEMGVLIPSQINWRRFDFTNIPVKMFDNKIQIKEFFDILEKMRTLAGLSHDYTRIKQNMEEVII
jgi:anaerobic magnesium-protoporphyrin IX monomethyl ester cyclase